MVVGRIAGGNHGIGFDASEIDNRSGITWVGLGVFGVTAVSSSGSSMSGVRQLEIEKKN